MRIMIPTSLEVYAIAHVVTDATTDLSSLSYELGGQYTRSGRPEILHLEEGVDYTVEV